MSEAYRAEPCIQKRPGEGRTGHQAPTEREPGAAQRARLLLSQPDVLKAAIHPVAGLWGIVVYLGRAYFEA